MVDIRTGPKWPSAVRMSAHRSLDVKVSRQGQVAPAAPPPRRGHWRSTRAGCQVFAFDPGFNHTEHPWPGVTFRSLPVRNSMKIVNVPEYSRTALCRQHCRNSAPLGRHDFSRPSLDARRGLQPKRNGATRAAGRLVSIRTGHYGLIRTCRYGSLDSASAQATTDSSRARPTRTRSLAGTETLRTGTT